MKVKQIGTVDSLHLVQAEYLDMPGLQLTKPQVERLWHLDDQACGVVLEELLTTHFLRLTSEGQYVLDAPAA